MGSMTYYYFQINTMFGINLRVRVVQNGRKQGGPLLEHLSEIFDDSRCHQYYFPHKHTQTTNSPHHQLRDFAVDGFEVDLSRWLGAFHQLQLQLQCYYAIRPPPLTCHIRQHHFGSCACLAPLCRVLSQTPSSLPSPKPLRSLFLHYLEGHLLRQSSQTLIMPPPQPDASLATRTQR